MVAKEDRQGGHVLEDLAVRIDLGDVVNGWEYSEMGVSSGSNVDSLVLVHGVNEYAVHMYGYLVLVEEFEVEPRSEARIEIG